ncbi:Thioredoxin-2 [Marinomonas spartinae]|uniref:Thioredoxin n=1 Tax=Marinomonas spartinae TaxID=1792290 RepID=A0A1A8TTL9_9GAMM|nr:thioredoxin TrxC [Marinomonas spartinae]SBS37823.1 Thioredoxin-2 [Marinomonas spartinae]
MNIACPHCFTINRIPEGKSHKAGKCGKCKSALHTTHPVNLTEQNFQQYIANTDLPIVVDFWAEWCGPCKMMGPVFSRLAERSEKALFAKVDTEQCQRISAQFNIRSIPTLIVFKSGKEINRLSGALPEVQLEQWINQNI